MSKRALAGRLTILAYRSSGPKTGLQDALNKLHQIEPNKWNVNGGFGRAILADGVLYIAHCAAMHRKITKTLKATLTPMTTPAKLPSSLLPVKVRETRVSPSFNAVPLRLALKSLADSVSLGVELDGSNLTASGVSADDPVKLVSQDLSLPTAIDLLCDSFRADWRIVDEKIFVTTKQAARATPLVLRWKLSTADRQNVSNVMHLIEELVPGDWEVNGGEGTIKYETREGALVIETDFANLRKVEYFLQMRRHLLHHE